MLPRVPLLAVSLLCAATARANVSLFPLFTDHAVLQRADRVPVWGRATPGENVTVVLGDSLARAAATAGADGKWTATLDLPGVGEGPGELVAAGADNEVRSVDVLVGEVWLCSGQSNMEFTLKDAAGAAREIQTSANLFLRCFTVTRDAEAVPVDTVRGRWELSGPATAGNFTAVGYYFARQVQAATHRPVGLIHSSWGGTPGAAWTSAEGFAASADAELTAGAERARQARPTSRQALANYAAWQARYLRQDHDHGATDDYTRPARADTDGWTTLALPASFAAAGLPDAGATWLQRTIPVREAPAGRSATLFLGDLHGSAEVYWNGKKIGAGDRADPSRSYTVDAGDLKVGDNVLAVRIFEADRGAEVRPGRVGLDIQLPDEKLALDGPWLAKAEFALPVLAAGSAPAPPLPPRSEQETASFLYNGMIAPLVPCALRGVLWYQGEANADRAAQYREAFPLMIADWRKHWGRGDFSFYWCQLASFQTRQAQPGEVGWAELRQAQTDTLRLPNTGQAILIDLGEEADIHPKDKADVGARLARIALARDYGQPSTVWEGPTFDAMTVDGGKVRLTFRHADGGLKAVPIPETYQPSSLKPETKPNVRHSPDGQLEGFVVCGSDHRWHWATAANIDGDSVVVTCADVPEPVAVRYAWASDPLCNFANGAGLPAVPFRTDDLPWTTAAGKY